MGTPAIARHHRIAFALDMDAGWYMRRPDPLHFGRVPSKLKVEQTQVAALREQGADRIITGPMRKGTRTFFTGLRPLSVEGWYIGNDAELVKGRKVLSLVLFQFSAEGANLTLFYFPRFYRDDRNERAQYAVAFINGMERQRAA